MSKDIKGFVEMIKNETAIQAKIKKAAEEFTGEKTDEAVWTDIMKPIADEAGFDVTFDDYKAYMDEANASGELSEDEMQAIAGGCGLCIVIGGSSKPEAVITKGDGLAACCYLGIGMGFFD